MLISGHLLQGRRPSCRRHFEADIHAWHLNASGERHLDYEATGNDGSLDDPGTRGRMTGGNDQQGRRHAIRPQTALSRCSRG
jgi:hypothetical protein